MRRPLATLFFTLWLSVPLTAFAATDPDALAKQATIRRDAFGVPHILAETEEAAAFANGYVAAEDHGPEIARLYLKARSREAAYFGKGFADTDIWTQILGVHDAAQAGYDQSPETVRAILDAYAAGFNRYMKQRNNPADAFEPVTGVDVLAHAMRVVNIEFALERDQLTLANRTAHGQRPGSNMFAVNKERSASGNAMLVGNPHLAWFGSQVWHELHITVPGVINCYGASLIGLPGIEIGFNEKLGWSHTVNPHDSTDIFELTLAPNDAESYVFDGGTRKLAKHTATVQVTADGKTTEQTRNFFVSHLGPIVAAGNGKAYALKSPNLDAYRAVEQWNQMAKARNLDEFKATLNLQGISMFNIAYADVDGNCFYVSNGRFPKRPAGRDWSGIVPADDSGDVWTDILSPAELPQLTNPKGGYVHNSNNAPWYTNLGELIPAKNFPADVFPDENDLRSQLGLRLIDSDTSLTFDEMLSNKLNLTLMLAERVKPDLIAAAKKDKSLKDAVAVLESWDNTASITSKGSVLFVAFWDAYQSEAKQLFATDWDPKRPMDTPQGLGESKLAAQKLAEAAKGVVEKYGAVDVSWGDVYRLRHGDVDVPLGGYDDNFGAYRVIGYQRDADGKMKALGGDSYVFGVEFTSPPRAVSVLPYSESADPKSPHDDDQTEMFAKGKFKDVWFTEDAIGKHTERSYHP